jgi:hypothetical protein
MDALRTISSAFNLPLTHFCCYTALLLLALRIFKKSARSIPSKDALLSQISASCVVYGRDAAAMLQPTADHRQRLRSGDAWEKVQKTERELGHTSATASSSDFMLPSKIVTRHLHVALTSDSDTFNLYTLQHNLLVGRIQWLSAKTQTHHMDVATRASQVRIMSHFFTVPTTYLLCRASCVAASPSPS